MEQTGYVIESKNGIAKIRVNRESACGGNCVSCSGCPANAVIVEAEDNIGLRKGDMITLYEDSRKVIKYAIIGYGFMALLLVIGAYIGYMITKRDIMALISAAVFLLVGFLIVKLIFKNVDSKFIIKNKVTSDYDINDINSGND
ncbi:MAG: SoxR reducing system RseC family protein [Clostridiales bacterium]|nr:SoxR reducing system RseC family protein [Clostridiales bacterium]